MAAPPHRKPVLSKLAGATPSLAAIAKSRVATVSALGARKMQVLGTVPRRQKPVPLPSMRTENQGQDSNVRLVPGGGWGAKKDASDGDAVGDGTDKTAGASSAQRQPQSWAVAREEMDFSHAVTFDEEPAPQQQQQQRPKELSPTPAAVDSAPAASAPAAQAPAAAAAATAVVAKPIRSWADEMDEPAVADQPPARDPSPSARPAPVNAWTRPAPATLLFPDAARTAEVRVLVSKPATETSDPADQRPARRFGDRAGGAVPDRSWRQPRPDAGSDGRDGPAFDRASRFDRHRREFGPPRGYDRQRQEDEALDDPEGPRRHALTLEEAEHRPAAGNSMLYDWRQDRRVTPSDHADRQHGRDRPFNASRDTSFHDRRFDSSRRGGRSFSRPFDRDQGYGQDHDHGRDHGRATEQGRDEGSEQARDPEVRDPDNSSSFRSGASWRTPRQEPRREGHAARQGTPPKVTAIAHAPAENTTSPHSATDASPDRSEEPAAERPQANGRAVHENGDEQHDDANPSSPPRRAGRVQDVRVRVGGSRSRLSGNAPRMAPVVRLPGSSRIRSDANTNPTAAAAISPAAPAPAESQDSKANLNAIHADSTSGTPQELSVGAGTASPKVIVHDHRTKRSAPRPARAVVPARPTFSSVAKSAPAAATPVSNAVKPSSLAAVAAKANTSKAGSSSAPMAASMTATPSSTSARSSKARLTAKSTAGNQRVAAFSRLSVADESDWSSESEDDRPSSPPMRSGLVVVPVVPADSTATATAAAATATAGGDDAGGDAEEFVEVLSRQKLKERRQQEEERQKQAERAERIRQERLKKKEAAKQLEDEKKRFLQEHMEQRERERKEQEERFRLREEARKQEEQRRLEQEAREKAEEERRVREAKEEEERLAKQREEDARREDEERLKREQEARLAEQKHREEMARLAAAASLAGKSYMPAVGDKTLLKEEPWVKPVRDAGLAPPEVDGRPSPLILDDESNIFAVSRRLWSTDEQSNVSQPPWKGLPHDPSLGSLIATPMGLTDGSLMAPASAPYGQPVMQVMPVSYLSWSNSGYGYMVPAQQTVMYQDTYIRQSRVRSAGFPALTSTLPVAATPVDAASGPQPQPHSQALSTSPSSANGSAPPAASASTSAAPAGAEHRELSASAPEFHPSNALSMGGYVGQSHLLPTASPLPHPSMHSAPLSLVHPAQSYARDQTYDVGYESQRQAHQRAGMPYPAHVQQGFLSNDQRARRTFVEAPPAAMVHPQGYVPASVSPQMHFQGPVQGMTPRFVPEASAGQRGPARSPTGYGAYSSSVSPALLGQHPMSVEAHMAHPVSVAVPPAAGLVGPALGVVPGQMAAANGAPRRPPPTARYGYSSAPAAAYPVPSTLGSSPNALMPYSTTGPVLRGYVSGGAVQHQQQSYQPQPQPQQQSQAGSMPASRAPVSSTSTAPVAPVAPPTLVSPPALAVASTASVAPSKPGPVIVDKRCRDSRRDTNKA